MPHVPRAVRHRVLYFVFFRLKKKEKGIHIGDSRFLILPGRALDTLGTPRALMHYGRRRCLDRLDSARSTRPESIGTHTVWHTDISIGICAGSRVSPRQNVEVRGLSSYL